VRSCSWPTVTTGTRAGLDRLPRVCDGKGGTIPTTGMVQAHRGLGTMQSWEKASVETVPARGWEKVE